jgi:hypothetical protein
VVFSSIFILPLEDVCSFEKFKTLFRLSEISKTFRYAAFHKSAYFRKISLNDAPQSSALSNMKSSVVDMYLSKCKLVHPCFFEFVIKSFSNLETLCINDCQQDISSIARFFIDFNARRAFIDVGDYSGRRSFFRSFIDDGGKADSHGEEEDFKALGRVLASISKGLLEGKCTIHSPSSLEPKSKLVFKINADSRIQIIQM